MKCLAIIITTLFALTAAASTETDPKKVAAILEGAKVCNTTADPVACMTGFMAALGIEPSEEASKKEPTGVDKDYSVRSFNDLMLCSLATQTEDGQKYWIINSGHSSYVAEARRRNLDCGINNKIKTSKTIEPIKEQFEKESTLLRKRTQYALLSYGYYKGSVDGVWGINTRNALLAYITKEKLTDWEPIRVFDYLRKDIGWSSAQDTSANSTELKANSSAQPVNWSTTIKDLKKLFSGFEACFNKQTLSLIGNNTDLFVRLSGPVLIDSEFVPKTSNQKYYKSLIEDHTKKILKTDKADAIEYLMACDYEIEKFKNPKIRNMMQELRKLEKDKALRVLNNLSTYADLEVKADGIFEKVFEDLEAIYPNNWSEVDGMSFSMLQRIQKKLEKKIAPIFLKKYDYAIN